METEVRNKKKRLSTAKIIIVAILALLVLLIVGFGLFTIFKLYRMRINATGTVPKPTVAPYAVVTAEPGIVIASTEPDDLSKDVDDILDPGLINKDPIYVENAIDPDVVNILVMGEDKTGDSSTGRSDVMILISYNQKLNTVKAISILRDTWIYIPGRNIWNRVNTAYRYGGIGLAINTINSNFELDIQYYMLTDFEKLIAIVDELGGLDMTLNASEIEYYNNTPGNPSTIKPDSNGLCHLDGTQVLMHCRNRTIGNGDWSRTERQRQVLTAFYERALREQDAASLTSLIYRLMDYVETNMSPWQMISIATSVVFNARGGMERASIPCSGSWSYAYEGSMAVIHMDLEANKQWLHSFIYGAH